MPFVKEKEETGDLSGHAGDSQYMGGPVYCPCCYEASLGSAPSHLCMTISRSDIGFVSLGFSLLCCSI